MSVLVMSEEAHATLAEVIRTVLDEGYNFFGFEAPQSLYDALDDCEFEDIRGCYSSAKIYRKLYTLNIKAYDNRYKIEEDDPIVPKMPDVPPLVQIRQYGSGHRRSGRRIYASQLRLLCPRRKKICRLGNHTEGNRHGGRYLLYRIGQRHSVRDMGGHPHNASRQAHHLCNRYIYIQPIGSDGNRGRL